MASDHVEGLPSSSADIIPPRAQQSLDLSLGLVGSLNQLPRNTISFGNLHANAGLGGSIVRPPYGRSVSSSHAVERRPDVFSRVHDTSNSIKHGRPATREWSVFGELYEREDSARASRLSTKTRTRQNANNDGTSFLDQNPRTPVERVITQEPSEDEDVSTEDYSDNSEEDDSQHQSEPESPRRSIFSRIPSLSPLQRNILKCSVAYFIASLFTFTPYLSSFIADLTNHGSGDAAPSPSGHMVATVAVYFNPAKTLGGMVEADLFCIMGLLFAAFVSLGSMSMFWFFEVRSGWEWLGDILVLLWIGTGMSLVAWMKVWMAKPAFNTACSMTAIILFVVVVKEGGLDTLLQVSFVILCGAVVSNVVCTVMWPQHATKNLQDTMAQTLQSFSTLLHMLTETFLLEEPLHRSGSEKLQRAAASHQASFTSLKKHFVEAQSEWMFGGPTNIVGIGRGARENSGQAYEDAIDSLTRLGQHLNGLRSGISLQYELIKAERDGKLVLKNRSTRRSKGTRTLDMSSSIDGKSSSMGQASQDQDDTTILQAAAEMFGDLIDDLGPPLKALSTTCTTALKRLRESFVQISNGVEKDTIQPSDFQSLADNIQRALYTFESTSNHAVLRLYRKHNISGTQSRDSVQTFDGEESTFLSGNDGESVFLVYFFIFTLQEFAKELMSLVDALERLYAARRSITTGQYLWRRVRMTVGASAVWRSNKRKKRDSIRKRISAFFTPGTRRKSVDFPKIKPHAPNTMQTPSRENLTFIGRIKQGLWALGARLREEDIKYAFKAGMATAMLAAPAFFESTRPMFVHYRGEWALISFFVVISPTIGATNFLGVHRVLGTLFGAATAAAVWTAFPENPIALSIFGFFYSIPCFYYIVAKPAYATSSRFVLLTYNLTCLYCYNTRQKDIAVTDVAFHRALAVTVGVVWAAIVSRYWWPTEARRALSKALGDFCLNMGWLYTRLVAFNSFAEVEKIPGHTVEDSPAVDENTGLLSHSPNESLTDSIHHFMAMELHLQIKLIELQGLLAQTQHEPRLKGPFPVVLYRSILTSLQTILDKLHSMRCVTSREEWHTTVRRDFILPVNKERREMVGNVTLYFSTLAAAFRLKSPLPPYLPPAEEARLRLVDAIRRLDVVRNRDVRGSRQLLFFAYALTMRGVIHELNYLGRTLQDAFGVIGQSREEFEALFTDTPEDISQHA